MSAWQDISTAPKDGSKWAPRFGPALLLTSDSGGWAIGYWDEMGLGPSGLRGWICIQSHRPLASQKWTHWQPLPEPPVFPEPSPFPDITEGQQ